MQAKLRHILVVVLAGFLLFACNLQSNANNGISPATSPTIYIQTLSALQTRAVMTATAQGVPGASTAMPIPPSGGTPGSPQLPAGSTPGVQGALVINDALCWHGPGPRYEVISAIFKGTQVQLLGRSVTPGWFIVTNPVYGDPCWILASDVQIGPGIDVNALPAYAIPAAPTPTPFPTLTGVLPLPSSTGTPVPPTPTLVPPSETPLPPLPSNTTQPPPTATTSVSASATLPAPTATP